MIIYVLTNRQTDRQTAATRREMLKIDNYAKKARPCGTPLNFVPLVMEHFGRWGPEAQKYLNHLSSLSTWTTGCPKDQFKNYWRIRLSVALQQCNARVLLQKMSRGDCSDNSKFSNSVSVVRIV